MKGPVPQIRFRPPKCRPLHQSGLLLLSGIWMLTLFFIILWVELANLASYVRYASLCMQNCYSTSDERVTRERIYQIFYLKLEHLFLLKVLFIVESLLLFLFGDHLLFAVQLLSPDAGCGQVASTSQGGLRICI